MTTGGPAMPSPRPAPLSLRLKSCVLGPALATERLDTERLGRPTALAVFASDNLSSVAYATEEMLRVLVPALGAAAFGWVLPLNAAVLVVLALLVVSYRQTLTAYPGGGGAYTVSHANLGSNAAHLAGAALAIDYVLTAAVSIAAGVAAIYSAVPALDAWRVPLAVTAVGVIGVLNLRGLRESGRVFAVPVYGFLVVLAVTVVVGLARLAGGSLPKLHPATGPGGVGGLALVWVLMRAFSSGGSALTGVEAISNGVGAFRPPEARNARHTLSVMAGLLGALFLGVSVLAVALHAAPETSQTLLSEIARTVYGDSAAGSAIWLLLQALTAGILILAANTAFADFPRLAAVMSADGALPSILARRGHRLVYSTGIIGLACAAAAVLAVFGASVDRLIPLYALGVFVSFTLSQAGMVRHHLRLRHAGWRLAAWLNGTGAFATAAVAVVVLVTKFVAGAWIVAVAIPTGAVLLGLRRRSHLSERQQMAASVAELAAPMRSHHQVVVLVEDLHAGVAEALRYARSLDPLGPADRLSMAWAALDLEVDLTVIACRDRDLSRGLGDWLVSQSRPDQELTVILPLIRPARWWHRLSRGFAAREIIAALSNLPDVRLVSLAAPHPRSRPAKTTQ